VSEKDQPGMTDEDTRMLAQWNDARAKMLRQPTPLQIFDWAVVRQSTLGPGVMVCAHAFNITAREVRDIVSEWNDPRGVLECVRVERFWRIDAYYNTTG